MSLQDTATVSLTAKVGLPLLRTRHAHSGLWDMTPCRFVHRYWHFETAFCLLLQGNEGSIHKVIFQITSGFIHVYTTSRTFTPSTLCFLWGKHWTTILFVAWSFQPGDRSSPNFVQTVPMENNRKMYFQISYNQWQHVSGIPTHH